MAAKSQASYIFLLGILLFFVAISLCQMEAAAEYRVFVLKISRAPAAVLAPDSSLEKTPLDIPPSAPNLNIPPPAPNPKAPAPASRLIQSTLDPNQYPGYYPLEKDESIVYVDTWKCPGRTGDFKPLCQRPSLPLQKPTPEPTLPP
ncbi:MAG: hypothetical protein JNM39_11500 [Bdellovibrionaceae bacterium]|nr:hypothetical protein [Pseudobdellovibrionaceae bacterium]